VLIVTCPCALSLAAPSALLAAAGALARRGLLLQRLEALEALAGIDTVVLDKTGTLTEDRLELAAVRLLRAGADEAQLRAHAASLAALSTHPAARALVGASGSAAGASAWSEVEEFPGAGLQARDAAGRCWRLGRADWVDAAQAPEAAPGGEVWFGCDAQALAVFELRETLRADAQATVQRLLAAGLHVMLLSGDAPQRARQLAQRLGIVEVHGGSGPADKLAAVAAAQQRGARVAMVGDGVNDAPVLARADVSFGFAHGAAVSRAQADLIVLGQRLGIVADAREHARKTLRVIRQNLAWAALYNAACVPLALVGWLPPWAAGLGMAGSSLLVVLNALRLARIPQGE
jgi:Cu2+-exporting ATPase